MRVPSWKMGRWRWVMAPLSRRGAGIGLGVWWNRFDGYPPVTVSLAIFTFHGRRFDG